MDRDFMKKEVYPALNRHLDRAFPEFRFRHGEPGWWVAQDAPDAYAEYGHKERKLLGTGWGFKSVKEGKPPVSWLAYLNDGNFPREKEFWDCVQILCEIAEVPFPEEELEEMTVEDKRKIEHHCERPHTV